jgi:hypothetical protein
MTWAAVTYAIWAFVTLAALFLWLASWRGWRVGRSCVGRPSALLRDALGGRTWLRVVVVLGWVWVGVHVFAR